MNKQREIDLHAAPRRSSKGESQEDTLNASGSTDLVDVHCSRLRAADAIRTTGTWPRSSETTASRQFDVRIAGRAR